MRSPWVRRMVAGVLLLAAPVRAQAELDVGSGDPAPAASADGDRTLAGTFFAEGLALAREGHYAAAKQAFLQAYQAHPHHAVLYNIAQAEIRLDNIGSAIEYLERFSSEGADALSAEQRAEVERRIAELRARLSEERPLDTASTLGGLATRSAPTSEDGHASATVAVESAEPSPAPAVPPATAPPASQASLSDVRSLQLSAAAAKSVSSAPTPRAGSPWGLILVSTGATLLGAATGLYVWNGDRHESWQDERATLEAIPGFEQALETDPQVWHEAQQNNDLLASIQRVDIVALVAASVGTLALGAGAWELIARPSVTAPAPTTSGLSFNWSTVW